MINAIDLQRIYNSYGFETESIDNDIAVFTYKKSRYFGVDIIPLYEDDNLRVRIGILKEQYSKLGFATTIKQYRSYVEADEELFKSFFSYDITTSRIKRKYNEFIKKQTQSLSGIKYQYISSPYEIHEDNYKGNLIDYITDKIMDMSESSLIIIEAAAGYGKTSTAYQIFDKVSENNSILTIPILTELSRNRSANVFRYILLDEIDKEHPTLSSELVIREVQKGRLPLIIDGFDELLDKVNLEADMSSLEEVESMLDTIGKLLVSSAKIILTTRKTAIFNGIEFEQWKDKWHNQFQVTRIGIKEPSIEDWLGVQRCILLDNYGVPLNFLANPVLLSHLRSLSDEQFLVEILNSQNIVEQYFNRLLEREKDRQKLLIAPNIQRGIFRNVVKMMIELDITSEKREFIKELIFEENIKILEEARLSYPEKTSIDTIVDSLATHALLDRKGRDGNDIGFINDFVLGIFIGEIITDDSYDTATCSCSSYMFELAVTAYKVQNEVARKSLWMKVKQISERFGQYTLFVFDVTLLNTIASSYNSLTVKEMTFTSTVFDSNVISNSVFVDCYFKRCVFNFVIFEGVSFINCCFTECISVDNSQLNNFKNIVTIGCVQKNCDILSDVLEKYEHSIDHDFNEIEIDILRLLWTFNINKKHYISSLVRDVRNTSFRKFTIALQSLITKGFVSLKGNQILLEMNKITEVKGLILMIDGKL